MKQYVQFKVLSLGYVSGTIPPIFKEENKKPIDLIGSDGLHYLDGRLSVSSCIPIINNILKRHSKKETIVVYTIWKNGNLIFHKKI